MTAADLSSEPADADVETLAKAIRRHVALHNSRSLACALLADPTLTPVFARAARPTGDPR